MAKWSMKTTALSSLAVVLLGSVIGCSSGSKQAAATGEKQDLSIWVSDWGASNNKLFDDSVAKYFSPSHPNINLKISHMKVEEKLLPAVASGNVPDLTYLNSTIAIPFAMNGTLQPMDEFMKQNKIDPVNDFSADINASYTWNGKLYGVGLAADSVALFWNKAAFKEAGLDPEKGPTSLQDISDFNRKLLKVDGGTLKRIGLNFGTPNIYSFYTLGVAMGSKWFDKQTNKAVVNDDATVKAFEYAQNEVKAVGINDLTKFVGGFGTGNNDPFYNGKQAMIIDGFWRVLDAKQFAPNFDYGVTTLPKSFAGQSWGFGIPTGAKNKKGAEEFLKWILTDKVAGKFMAEGTNPFNFKPGQEEWFKALAEISKGTPNEKYLSVWKTVLQESQENTYMSPAPAAQDQWLTKAYDDVIHGKSPKEALDVANKQIQAEIDKALSAAKK